MSYRPNQSQQLSIFDRRLCLTDRERKCLEKSWAKVFSDEIFPAIDEDHFRVLYSETASRPNTPVNVIVGALIIKELFDLSDDEVVENLMLDVHYQYCVCAEISAQSILGRKVQRDRENTAAVVRMEKGDNCRGRGVSGSYSHAS